MIISIQNMKMSWDDFCCVRKFAEDKNFAPKQDESECPMTILSQGKHFYPILGQKFYPVRKRIIAQKCKIPYN